RLFPFGLSSRYSHFLSVFLEDAGADVAGLVNAVAETHHAFLASQGIANPLFRRVGAAGGADQVHHLFVGPAVKRTLESADGGNDAGVQVGLRRANDTRGERRGVKLVLGIENQGYVKRPSDVELRLRAAQEKQEVRARGQIGARDDFGVALAEAIKSGNRQRDLREQAFGLAQVGGVRVVADFRIV